MRPSIDDMKAQARRLRGSLSQTGNAVSHSQALELVAQAQGYRDWNTAHAAAGNAPPGPPVAIGDVVTGRYLAQPMIGEVIGVQSMLSGNRWRVTIQLDEPVDVVTFDSFSAFRRRITATIDRNGVTAEHTSNGLPHLKLEL